MRYAAILFLSLAPLAFAQAADVELRTPYDPYLLAPSDQPFIFIEVDNHGPDAAANVSVTATVDGAPAPVECSGCPLTLPANGTRTIVIDLPPLQLGARFAVNATVTSDTSDPNPANNSISTQVVVSDAPDLYIQLRRNLEDSDPALPFSGQLIFGNRAAFPAHDAAIVIDYAPDVRLTAVKGLDCTIFGSHAFCPVGDVGPNTERTDVVLAGIQPARFEGGKLPYAISIRSGDGADLTPSNNIWQSDYTLYRTFLVTNTSDDGDGSLRRAIETANQEPCLGPCKVSFRIDGPVPEEGLFTITPRTPLPPITGTYIVDGHTQTRFTGETNPSGPEVALSGLALKEGNGLTLGSCYQEVRGLTIGDFPENGIFSNAPTPCQPTYSFNGIWQCNIARNLRGIVGNARLVQLNTITANRRSGVFITGGAANIVGNEITGNGASGVYIDASGSSVSLNTIANHPDFGIAVDRGARLVDLHANEITGAGKQAIDLGLDGQGTPFDVQPPRLTGAVYDPATGLMTIEGIAGQYVFHYATILSVDLFANDHLEADGSAQAMKYVGGQMIGNTFKITVKAGDLSGKFITATETLADINTFDRATNPDADLGYEFTQTSELSAPVMVAPR